MMLTWMLDRPVRGRYRRYKYETKATRVPISRMWRMASTPPHPYTRAVASEEVRIKALKKKRP